MHVFKTPAFSKWAKKEKLTDAKLWNAASEMQQGLVDADLGGGVRSVSPSRLAGESPAAPGRW